jgi:hypothetical protein
MITLLLLAALPQGETGSEPARQARLHPAQSVVYVEMPDVQKMLDAYREAPTVQMIGSEEVVAAVGEFLDSVEIDLDGVVGHIAGQIGVPVEMIRSPGEKLAAGLRQVSGASISMSLLESDAGELESTIDRVAACTKNIVQLTDELFLFAAEHDELFPSSLTDLDTETSTVDPWGRPYFYSVDADGMGFELRSLGEDGQPGGDGAATDLDADTYLTDVLETEFLRRIGSTAVVEFTTEDVALQSYQFLRDMAGKMGLQTTLGAYTPAADSGVELSWYQVAASPQLPLWTMRSGHHLAIGFGSSDPESFLTRLSGEDASAGAAPAHTELRERLGASAGAFVMQGFIDLSGLAQCVADLDVAGSGLDFIAPYLSSRWRMALDGDRFVTEVHGAAPERDNALAQCLGCKPVPESLWNYIPPESIAVWATTIDGPSLYRMLREGMGSEAESEHVPGVVRELEERHQFNLRQDVFASLGSGAAFYLLPIGGLMSMPGMVVVLELDDAESFQVGLEGLLAALQEQGGSDFEIKYRPYRDAPLWYFSFGGESGSPIPISPALAIIDDHLLITLTSVRAKKEIKRILAGPSERHPLLTSTNTPREDAVSVGYMDWGTLFEGVYEGGRAALAFMGGGMELPFDITTLPEGSTFSQFYEPTVSWSRKGEQGFYIRTESSFGPETLLGLAALGGGAFLGFQAVSEGAIEIRKEVEIESLETEVSTGTAGLPAESETAETMRFLSTRLAVYRLEVGSYPSDLAKLMTSTANYPQGFLDGEEVPTDGWGRAFSYAASPDATTYRLWSNGVDGIDQGGEGDDLVED